MTMPRLSPASSPIVDNGNGIEGDKIAKSESLSALFSYFKNWSLQDSSLKFKADSILKVQDEEVA